MTDLGIYIKNADIQALAGINAGTDAKATAQTDVYVLNVEADINDQTLFDWSAAITAGGILDAALQLLLKQTGAAKCAMNVINADPTGYSVRERETAMDFLNSMFDSGIKTLKDKDTLAFIKGET
ncbi:MAG TPA: hypothetical protein ENI23_16590 [bacterium]|nr:hypothetical protein [bacterium]